MAGYADTKEQVVARLRRVEGQVRGIAQMVENDRYCIDVLTQLTAANKALEAVALELLDDHLRHCVVQAIESDDMSERDHKITEATAAIRRLVRS